MTVISLLITAAMGWVVFSDLGPKAGLWDDLAFVAAALTFLWAFVRLIGDRVFEIAAQGRRHQEPSHGGGRDPRRAKTG